MGCGSISSGKNVRTDRPTDRPRESLTTIGRYATRAMQPKNEKGGRHVAKLHKNTQISGFGECRKFSGINAPTPQFGYGPQHPSPFLSLQPPSTLKPLTSPGDECNNDWARLHLSLLWLKPWLPWHDVGLATMTRVHIYRVRQKSKPLLVYQ